MKAVVAIGTQWGDEGKAKIIDFLTKESDIVVRYQGGANAGHTVVVGDQKYIFHLIPSGILHKDKICVIGNGLVLDPIQLIKEINDLEEKGIEVRNRLIISDSLHLILPYHKALDSAMEELRDNKIGTTNRGIGPCYADKCLRIGIRAGDILDQNLLAEKISLVLKFKNLQLKKVYQKSVFTEKEIFDLLDKFRVELGDLIQNSSYFLSQSIQAEKRVLLEGAQGFALDIDHGTYPYVTSSNPTIGGALLGSGLNASDISEVIGITKAYVTRVGEGPFPTYEDGPSGQLLQQKGGEFGATTGRPRRCGWFDLQLLKQAKRINGLTRLALTKIDVLSGLDKIKVAIGYEINGKKVEAPSNHNFYQVKPVYEELPGWSEDLTLCKSYQDLPSQAKDYIKFIQEQAEVKISIVSVGPGREQTFLLE